MVDCSPPLAASGVIIEPFNNTKFGALITFHCEESDYSMSTVCGSDGEWIPDPASLDCPTAAPGINNCRFTRIIDILCIVSHQLVVQLTAVINNKSI